MKKTMSTLANANPAGSRDDRQSAGRTAPAHRPGPSSRPDDLLRRAGVALVTGSLVLAMVPTAAIADDAATSSTTATSQGSASDATGASGQGAPSGTGETPPEPPSGSDAPDIPTPDASGQGQGQPGDASQGQPDGQGQGQPGGGGADTQSFDYSGTYTGALTADGQSVTSSDQTVTATESDQNAVLVQNAGSLDASGLTLQKSGDDTDGDRCNFYGVNSVLLSVGEGSLAKVSSSTISATSAGSNALFATDSATIYAKDDTIHTTADNSRGLDATYGGTIIGESLDVSTEGDHCAALATDRGGGNVSLANSTLSTQGSGSPLLYSTGDIEVSGVSGTASGSQIAGMEGLNTILIQNSSLESTNTGTTGSDPVANGVIIYQSTSGDAETTTGDAASFQAIDSSLKSSISSGSFFYVTNTTANILLKQTSLDFDSSAAKLLQVEGNSSNNWGSAGSNGATVNFTCSGEDLKGDVSVDTISSATLYLTAGTSWQGAASITQNASAAEGSATEAPLTVNVDASSTWVVTADSTVTNLNVAQGGKLVDASGNAVTVKDSSGTTLAEGSSSVTVTVTGSYSTQVGSDAVAENTDTIDRSGFEEAMGTSQAGGSTSSADQGATTGSWWDQVVSFFKGIFGM